MKEKLLKHKYIWLAFLVALIPRLLFLIKTYPVSISGDELFAMWPVAKLLGRDWSGVMGNYRYYGYGFSVLWIPFMTLIKDPVILYRSMVSLMIFCQAAVAPVSYHLMSRYLHVENKKQVCLLAIASSYLVTVRATYTYPEFIYDLMVWIIAWILLKLITEEVQTNKKAKMFYSLVLILALAYAYMVHSRAVALWGALLVTILLCGWIYRKALVSIPVCLVTGIPAFLLVRVGISKVIGFLEKGQDGGVSNTSTGVSVQLLDWFKNPKSWTAWANIIIGELNESVVLTGGLAVALVVAICLLIWRGFCRESEIVESKKNQYLPYIVIGIFCIFAIGSTIGGQSLTWLGGVTLLMEQSESGDVFRAITYLRYYGAYIGPLFMVGAVYMIKHMDIMEKIKGKVLLITSLLQGYWVLVILPILCYELGCVWSYAPFSLTKGFAADSVGLRSYLPATVFVFVFSLVAYKLFKRKKVHVLIGLLCVVLIYTYAFNGFYHERYRGEQNYLSCQPLVEWIREEEEKGSEIDKIYVEEGALDAYELQYLLADKIVVIGRPDQSDGAYLCSEKKSIENIDKKLRDKATEYEIDEDTYIYLWDQE